MKRTLVMISVWVAMSLALSACGGLPRAGGHLEAIREAGVMKVGVSADYPPFESVDKKGNKVGFDIDLMLELARRLGVELKWVDLPFDSLIPAVEQGRVDASISAFAYTAQRDQAVDFTDAYYTAEDAFTATDSFTGTISQPEDVAAYKIGVLRGSTQDGWLTNGLLAEGGMQEANLYRYGRFDQALLDLKGGRIDLVMSDYIPARSAVQRLGGLKIVYRGILSAGALNMVVPEGDTELKKAINQIIKELQNEGFIDALAIKYFGA
ncbi:MAG: ABC transporter substrate-binding protein [Bacteroidota bacterium]